MPETPSDGLVSGDEVPIPVAPGAPEQVHVLAPEEVEAIRVARDARRALLVRGEPGTGKTQLARAAAVKLGRAFVAFTVDSRTEARDLLWHVDAVRRLADAQVRGALRAKAEGSRAALDILNYVEPRVLWWAFNWGEATRQAKRAGFPPPPEPAGWKPEHGVVALIDEIDKGDSDVPNGLLEALGATEFSPPGYAEPIRPGAAFPLVIVTTNNERDLPDAFVRRCVVLHLRLPRNDKDLIARLVTRGHAHFKKMNKDLIREAAELLAKDRKRYLEEGLRPLPGQAEFMDLLRVLHVRGEGAGADLDAIAQYAVRKNTDAVPPG